MAKPIKVWISDQVQGVEAEPSFAAHELGDKHSIEIAFPAEVVAKRGMVVENRRPMTQEEIDLLIERTNLPPRSYRVAFDLPLGRKLAIVDEELLEEFDHAKRQEMLMRLFLADLTEHVELPIHLAVMAATILGGAAEEAA